MPRVTPWVQDDVAAEVAAAEGVAACSVSSAYAPSGLGRDPDLRLGKAVALLTGPAAAAAVAACATFGAPSP